MIKKKILIVEDNEIDVHHLKTLLQTYSLDTEIVGIASNASEAYNLILETTPDIVFLDMELNNSKGFEVLEMLDGEGDFQIIAQTSHKEYALDCYGHNVIDFLLKPYTLESLLTALNKAKAQLSLLSGYNTISSKELNTEFAKFLALTSLEEALVVKPVDIRYLKAEGRYTSVVLNSGKIILITRMLGEFEKLIDPAIFFRVHNSYIINLNSVLSFDRPKTTFCLLNSGEKIPVSQRKVAKLSKILHIKG